MTPNEYLYSKALECIKKFDDSYYVIETGTDAGTTAMWFLKALHKAESKKWLFTVDPHGDKPYRIADADHAGFQYGDQKYRSHLMTESKYAHDNELNHVHWKLRSQDFLKILPHVQFWTEGNYVKEWKFCFAYLDGEHSWDTILIEIEHLYPLMPKGSVIVIDDYNLIGDEATCTAQLEAFPGELEFNVNDECYRIYLTK